MSSSFLAVDDELVVCLSLRFGLVSGGDARAYIYTGADTKRYRRCEGKRGN
jgi:hypothetical protein